MSMYKKKNKKLFNDTNDAITQQIVNDVMLLQLLLRLLHHFQDNTLIVFQAWDSFLLNLTLSLFYFFCFFVFFLVNFHHCNLHTMLQYFVLYNWVGRYTSKTQFTFKLIGNWERKYIFFLFLIFWCTFNCLVCRKQAWKMISNLSHN